MILASVLSVIFSEMKKIPFGKSGLFIPDDAFYVGNLLRVFDRFVIIQGGIQIFNGFFISFHFLV